MLDAWFLQVTIWIKLVICIGRVLNMKFLEYTPLDRYISTTSNGCFANNCFPWNCFLTMPCFTFVQYKLFPESCKSWRMYPQRKSRSLLMWVQNLLFDVAFIILLNVEAHVPPCLCRQTCRFRQEDVF